MTMVTCMVYDMCLFLIFATNTMYHDENILPATELSLLLSCLFFGLLFEIVGRKKIFTMRLCITSLASLLVPYSKRIPFWVFEILPVQTLAFVMCSVSLTVPFIPDFVKNKYRGLAYGYLGLLLAFALVVILTIVELDYENTIDQEWFFVITSSIGLISAVTFCSFFKDK